jgi:sigma-B regulation protein RsbU (phosphoserine phosphatase)
MELVSYRYWRRRAALFWPTSVIGKLALYFAGIWLVLLGARLAAYAISGTDRLAGLATIIGIARFGALLFVTILLLRWVRHRFLWKLRNRLIVTYFFIGVIPAVLLITIALISGTLFLNQYATSQARTMLEAELRAIAAVNENIARELTMNPKSELKSLEELHALSSRYDGLQVAAWKDGVSVEKTDIGQPTWSATDASMIAQEHERLFLRAITHLKAGGNEWIVVSSVPLAKSVLDKSQLGEITLFIPKRNNKGNIQVRVGGQSQPGDADYDITPYVTGGRLPEARGWWDREGEPTSFIPYRNWTDGRELPGGVRIKTRSAALITELFSSKGEFAAAAMMVLIIIAIFFALIELIAIYIGVRLTRSITGSVYRLYQATQHINRGDLKHRIDVRSNDQLAALQKSFNSMSESLEQLIAEQKVKQRLENELAIAQEVQETLFPRMDLSMQSLELHGICKPARTVSGDYYDFLSGAVGSEQLTIAIGDISGKGISAALLMATVHSAVRAYQYGQMPSIEPVGAVAMAGVAHVKAETARGVLAPSEIQSPGDVLELLNRHLYHSTQPEKYATMFLGVWDGPSRTLTYSNAGHLPPIVISPDGSVRRLEEGGMVIGLFDEMVYEERSVTLAPNDIFVAFSDGVTEPENEFGEFGEQRLIDLILEHRRQPLGRISEAVTTAVQDWIGANEQPDDITLVLARAR